MNERDSLKEAIRRAHGCNAKFIESVDVVESFQGKTVWDGVVSLFELSGHPAAKRCYAWCHRDEQNPKETRFFTVLELPPVDSPIKAVRAAIVSQTKRK